MAKKLEKSSKRETALINLGIVNRTWKVFPEEEKSLLASTNLMRRMTSISKAAVAEMKSQAALSAVMNLFARNRELVHFAIVCLMNGGYASTKVLSRAALENTLYMRLFNKKSDLAKKWFTNPEKFRENWTPQRVRDELFEKGTSLWNSYNQFYWILCNYSHPSFKGWGELTHETKGMLWCPVFNEDYADECLGLIFFLIAQTLMPFTVVFTKWLPRSLTEELRNMGTRVSQMVRRHFQVKIEPETEREWGV